MMTTTYPAIVLAGYSTRKPDPLAAAMGMERKALIPIAGKPMVAWVVDALRQSPRVGRIYVVGIQPEDRVDFGTEVVYVPNQDAHFENIMAGVNAVQTQEPEAIFTLIASADIPALHTETVTWFIETCEAMEGDFFYSVVEKSVMERMFPDSRRSYVPIKEGRFCGGDLFFVRLAVAHTNQDLVRELLARRKSPLQQARLLGLRVIVKFLFRRLSIQDAEAMSQRLLQARGKVVVSPYADLGMDVDKPHQLEIVRALLEARQAS